LPQSGKETALNAINVLSSAFPSVI